MQPMVYGRQFLRGRREMPKETRSAPIGVRLTPSLKAELEQMAERDNRSLASLVETVLKDYVVAKKSEGKPAGKRK
jgi:predicted HicB family RNase H-like nuclease